MQLGGVMPGSFAKAGLLRLMTMPKSKAQAAEKWRGSSNAGVSVVDAESERTAAHLKIAKATERPGKNPAPVPTVPLGNADAAELELANERLRRELAATVSEKDDQIKKRDLKITELRKRLSRMAKDDDGVGWNE
jgi:hypothetical protein